VKVEHREDDDWFDPVLTEDTPLYVDPFLVFDDDDPLFADMQEQVVAFFAMCHDLVRRAAGNTGSPHWKKALRLLTFPEPKEFALGLAMGSPNGAGTGGDLAVLMADALEVMTRAVERGVSFVDVFAVFVPGLGIDRISDMFCNIMKARFIRYTQRICAARGIATEVVTVRNAGWQESAGRWSDARVALPRSPVTGGAVLLTPDRFLQDIPQRVTANGFWDWADARIGMELRADLNYAIGEELSKKEKRELGRRLARRSPHTAFEYVEEEAEREHRPYDVRTDPDLLVGWFEPGRAASRIDTAENGVLPQPANDGFCAWVGTLVDRFTHVVENTDLWRVLWNEDLTKPRKELVVQAVAAAMWIESCRAAGVDFNRETNVGRGPVDFKFSAGWQHRALLEVKLARSTKLLQGAQAQLPQYLRSEQIRCGYYVCVGFTDAELSAERIERVTETCATLSGQTPGWTITPRFIDARPKQSASKL
jgi:hypothetical protein